MRVLVLGGSGFLGSHIVDKFSRKSTTYVYDLYPERFRRSRQASSSTRRLRQCRRLEELIATKFDAVIHCVSTTTPKSSNESPEFDIQSNVIGTLYLLDICAKHKVASWSSFPRAARSTAISAISIWLTRPTPSGPCAPTASRS